MSLDRAIEVANRMSEFSDALDQYGPNSPNVQTLLSQVEEDPDIAPMARLLQRIRFRERQEQFLNSFPSLWDQEEDAHDRAWRLMAQGGVYTLRVQPYGRHHPGDSYSVWGTHENDQEAQWWAQSVLRGVAYQSHRVRGMLTRLEDGRRFKSYYMPRSGDIHGTWVWEFRKAGRVSDLDHRCYSLPEEGP